MNPTFRTLLPLLATIVVSATPAAAQPGWGRHGDDFGPTMRGPGRDTAASKRDPREGKVQAEQFQADGAVELLGKGPIDVRPMAGTTATGREQAVFEAAVIDQLVMAGYDTTGSASASGQVVELRVVRDVVVPEEAKRNPVSGAVSVGASNRGTMTAMAIGVDLTKPRKALVSTRLEARIRDQGSDNPLWEGRATIITRDGDEHWTEQAISTRLAAALFEKFPSRRDGAHAGM